MRIGYMYKRDAYPPKGGNHTYALEPVHGFLQERDEVCVHEDPATPAGATNISGSSESGLEAFVENTDVLYVRIDVRYVSEGPKVVACIKKAGDRPAVVWEINSPANEMLVPCAQKAACPLCQRPPNEGVLPPALSIEVELIILIDADLNVN